MFNKRYSITIYISHFNYIIFNAKLEHFIDTNK